MKLPRINQDKIVFSISINIKHKSIYLLAITRDIFETFFINLIPTRVFIVKEAEDGEGQES